MSVRGVVALVLLFLSCSSAPEEPDASLRPIRCQPQLEPFPLPALAAGTRTFELAFRAHLLCNGVETEVPDRVLTITDPTGAVIPVASVHWARGYYGAIPPHHPGEANVLIATVTVTLPDVAFVTIDVQIERLGRNTRAASLFKVPPEVIPLSWAETDCPLEWILGTDERLCSTQFGMRYSKPGFILTEPSNTVAVTPRTVVLFGTTSWMIDRATTATKQLTFSFGPRAATAVGDDVVVLRTLSATEVELDRLEPDGGLTFLSSETNENTVLVGTPDVLMMGRPGVIEFRSPFALDVRGNLKTVPNSPTSTQLAGDGRIWVVDGTQVTGVNADGTEFTLNEPQLAGSRLANASPFPSRPLMTFLAQLGPPYGWLPQQEAGGTWRGRFVNPGSISLTQATEVHVFGEVSTGSRRSPVP